MLSILWALPLPDSFLFPPSDAFTVHALLFPGTSETPAPFFCDAMLSFVSPWSEALSEASSVEARNFFNNPPSSSSAISRRFSKSSSRAAFSCDLIPCMGRRAFPDSAGVTDAPGNAGMRVASPAFVSIDMVPQLTRSTGGAVFCWRQVRRALRFWSGIVLFSSAVSFSSAFSMPAGRAFIWSPERVSRAARRADVSPFPWQPAS